MIDKVLLPINNNPILQAYQLKAFELGIIQANEKSIRPWVYNKYINQLYMFKGKRTTYTNYDRWHADEGVTQCQKFCVTPSIVDSDSFSLLSFIKEMLHDQNYVFGRYNEYYIEAKNAYNKNYYIHDFFIYGYDDSEEVFYSVGYTKSRKYEPFIIKYTEFYQSLRSVKTEKLNFHFIKYKNGINHQINIREIYDDLYDYVHSINSRPIVNYDKVFGISCEEVFVKHLQEVYEENSYIDIRQCRFFAEMKELMRERLEYLLENHYLTHKIAVDNYRVVAERSKLIHMLSLKHNTVKDKSIVLRIIENQKQIIEAENLIFPIVLDDLKQFLAQKNSLRDISIK